MKMLKIILFIGSASIKPTIGKSRYDLKDEPNLPVSTISVATELEGPPIPKPIEVAESTAAS